MYTLYIGNKNYSSWSLRAWVLMQGRGHPVSRSEDPALHAGIAARLLAVSPSGRVPCLHDGDTVVWDTLAIAEYLAERHPGLWPAAMSPRAPGRAASPRRCTRALPTCASNSAWTCAGATTAQPSPADRRGHRAHRRDLARGARAFRRNGDFLCGAFGIVDAFWCPVAFRFRSYGVALTGASASYCQSLLAFPAMQEWAAGAARERESDRASPPAALAQQP